MLSGSPTGDTGDQVSNPGCKDAVGVTGTPWLFKDMKCGISSLTIKGSEGKRMVSASCSFWVETAMVSEMLLFLFFKCV